MMSDAMSLSVVARAASAGRCELCATETATLEAAEIVRHIHGGTVQFVACDCCTRAIRRVAAAIDGEGQLTQVATSEATGPTPARRSSHAPQRGPFRAS